ncbi:MAG: VOC family protein [Actinomycetota bacterium]|nr:VOC family protein [Actinomycetota bacterium]
MPSKWYSIVVDSANIKRLADFWTKALDYKVMFEADDEIVIAKDENSWPNLVFGPVPEEKAGKNRLHIDLNPDDQEAEVKRLEGLGAKRVDIGQGDVRWVVMADPEGNEFCVLTPHPEQS